MKYPSTAKTNMTTMSQNCWPRCKPRSGKKGGSRGKGSHREPLEAFTQSPISGRFKTRSMTFPVYMLVITPQKISGCSFTKSGPGCTPWVRKAPMSTAMTTLGGMPRVSRGTMTPCRGRIIRRFRRGHPLDDPGPELFRMFGKALFQTIRNKGGNDGPDPRQNPEEEAQKTSPGNGHGGILPILLIGKEALDVGLGRPPA